MHMKKGVKWLFCLFFSSTLCTEEVTAFLNTRMLFWACSTSKPEGYRGIQMDCYLTHPLFIRQLCHSHVGTHHICMKEILHKLKLDDVKVDKVPLFIFVLMKYKRPKVKR